CKCPPPPQYGSVSYDPTYLVLSLLYAPPGKASSAGFSQTASQGETVSVSNSFGQGVNISFTVGDVGASAGASFGVSSAQGDTQSFQLTQSSSEGAQLRATSDNVDHSQDRFFLCLNCEVIVTQTGDNTGTYTVAPQSGQPADIIDVSVWELQNPQSIPPS